MIKKILHFWSEERSLTTLLALLAIHMFVLDPVIREGARISLLRDVVFSLLLMAGMLTITRQKTVQILFVMFVGTTIIVHWMRIAVDSKEFLSWDASLSLLSVLALTAVVLAQLNRKGPVTGHRVRGAVAGYLLLALSCACAYSLIDFLIPGAFQMPALDVQAGEARSDAFVYFSVVTLTTLGYGDITAIHPVARSVVMIEAMLGQLYPAILIARLVTLEMETRRNRG